MKLKRFTRVEVCWTWTIVLLYLSIESAENRAIPDSSEGKTNVTSVNVGSINFDEGQVAVAATVEANRDEIQFQSDKERDAELRPRHRVPLTHNPSNFSRISSILNHTGEPKSDSPKTDQDSSEALEEFLEWVSGKGIPTTSVFFSSKEINSEGTTTSRNSSDAQYSIAAGGSIPCEKEEHIRTEDGICREVAQFK